MLALLIAWPLALDAKPVEPPKLLFTAPLAVAVGAPAKMKLHGAKLETITGVQVNSIGVAVRLTTAGKKLPPADSFHQARHGDSEAEIELTVPADFAGETVVVAVANAGGASNPLVIPVARNAVTEVEPNHTFATAQAVKTGQTVEGVIQYQQDVDIFKLDAVAGQTLAVTVARHGSPLDLRVTLYDAQFQEVAVTPDATAAEYTFSVKLPKAGAYFIAVQDANDAGGPQHGYRLTVK
jgi:hypothetical protein